MPERSRDFNRICEVVLEAIRDARTGEDISANSQSELSELVDSLGLLITISKVKSVLQIEVQPDELLTLVESRAISDLASAFSELLHKRGSDSSGHNASLVEFNPSIKP
jgi:acyl carrier protein